MGEPWYRDGLRFRCTRCGHCCTGAPGYVWVTPEELQALADFLGQPPDEVRALYARPDASVAADGPRCDASGRCCRFAEYGHTLFVSQLEADVLLSAAPSFDGPVSADRCPFQVGNLCTAREPRPLGCRVYF